MGNCLKSPTSDDISLLHESQSDRASYGDGTDHDQEPPPPYQVISLPNGRGMTESAHCAIKPQWDVLVYSDVIPYLALQTKYITWMFKVNIKKPQQLWKCIAL